MTTTYRATATRSGHWWAIEVTHGLPHDMLGVTQVRRLSEVQRGVKDVIADLLDVDQAPTGDVEIDVIVTDEMAELIELYRRADEIESAARAEAANARSSAAAGLLDSKLTLREAGILLGVSHQRIKQLADRANG